MSETSVRKQPSLGWVLVLTAAAALIVALDQLVVATAVQTIRDGPERVAGRPGVDGQRLQPQLRRFDDPVRGPRGPDRPQADVLDRAGCVRAGLGRVCAGADHRSVDHGAGRPGRRGGSDLAGRVGVADRGNSAGQARRGHGYLRRGDGPGGRRWPAGRWRGHRGAGVAVDLLDQCSGDRGGRAAGRGEAERDEGRPGAYARSCGSGARRVLDVRHHLGVGALGAGGLGQW